MTTFTKEQLIEKLKRKVAVAERYPDVEEAKFDVEVFRIALASLDAGSNSHFAHGSISNDRLHRISDILSKAAAQRDGGNIGYAMSDAVKAIDELLEARKVEPVAWTDEEELRDVRRVGFGEMFSVEPISPNADMCRVIPLYTTPPAPVDDGWLVDAKRLAERHGISFVVFRHGDDPQCADPTKVVISLTDKG